MGAEFRRRRPARASLVRSVSRAWASSASAATTAAAASLAASRRHRRSAEDGASVGSGERATVRLRNVDVAGLALKYAAEPPNAGGRVASAWGSRMTQPVRVMRLPTQRQRAALGIPHSIRRWAMRFERIQLLRCGT